MVKVESAVSPETLQPIEMNRIQPVVFNIYNNKQLCGSV